MQTPTPTPLLSCPLDEADATKSADLLKAIAEPTRLRILAFLRRHGGRATVRDITTGIGSVTQQDISSHLRVLRSHGLITATKRGKYTYYLIEEVRLLQAHNVTADLLPARRATAHKKSA